MNAKEYYRTYMASNKWSDMSSRLISEIINTSPVHCLEFGQGSGKHLKVLQERGIVSCGIDVGYLNFTNAAFKNDVQFLILGDETNLRHLCNFDVVFTCSVLDHIEDVDGIIQEFQRIANKAVFLAETNSGGDLKYYYSHDYESYGFKKLDLKWIGEDDCIYHIWVWNKEAISNEQSISTGKPHRR